MRIRSNVTEHGRVAGQDYSVPFYIGCRLIRYRHAKFIRIEPGEPEWRPAEPLCVPDDQQRGISGPQHDKMLRGPQVNKGAA